MSPRTPNPEIASYRPVLSIAARDALTALAGSLHFTVTQRGRYFGDPSVSDMLESLAVAHGRDPNALRLALKMLGVVAEPTEPDAE